MKRFSCVAAALGVLVLAANPTSLRAHEDAESACSGTTQTAELAAARAELQASPDALAVRLKVSDLLLNAGCYHEAVDLLETGERQHPHNPDLQNRLTHARSMLREKIYFEGMDQVAASAQQRRQLFRCMQLGDIQACDEAQAAAPGNAEIAMAKGDALQAANRIDDAIAAYSHAVTVVPGNALLNSKLQSAQSRRQSLMRTCQADGGESALEACQAVLNKGSASELEVTLRIALLQQSIHQSAQALDTYIAANALQPGNRSVALAILALLESTQRQDALGLQARGSSLMTLGRPAEAVGVFQQAAALAPGLPNISAQLTAAQDQARAEVAVPPAVTSPSARAIAHEARPHKVSDVVTTPPPAYSNDEPATRSN